VWDSSKGQELYALIGHTKAVRQVGWSQDGSLIVTASDDNTAVVWEARENIDEKNTSADRLIEIAEGISQNIGGLTSNERSNYLGWLRSTPTATPSPTRSTQSTP